jgi:hypothetical protein
MKKSEILKAELATLNADNEKAMQEIRSLVPNHTAKYNEYWNGKGKNYFQRERELKDGIIREERREVEVGDGVTVCLYSDRHAGTVIKRTKCTITVQRDKATLNPDFKPEVVAGGFAGHCTNQDEQTYTYERDSKGSIETYRWSEKRGIFQNDSIKVINGRREFYDYNF